MSDTRILDGSKLQFYAQDGRGAAIGYMVASGSFLNLTSSGGFSLGTASVPTNLVFAASSSITGGGASTISLGVSGDTFNLNVDGVTYNFKDVAASGNLSSGGTLAVTGAATLSSTLSVTGNITCASVNGYTIGHNTHATGSDNQNLFSHIHVYSTGTTDVTNSPHTVDSQTDHIQFLKGTNITLSMDTAGIITIAAPAFGSTAGTICEGNDTRLSNARTPTSHGDSYHSALAYFDTISDGTTSKSATTAKQNIKFASGNTTGLTVAVSSDTTYDGIVTMTPVFGNVASSICEGNDPRLHPATLAGHSFITDQTLNKVDTPIFGALTLSGGGAGTLSLKAGPTTDHVYMQFYRDSQSQSTRSGYIGYGSGGTVMMTIANEMTNGGITLTPNGTGIVTVSSGGLTISSGNIVLSGANATVDGVDISAFKSAYDTHASSTDLHVSTTERTQWNAAYTHSTSGHAPVDSVTTTVFAGHRDDTTVHITDAERTSWNGHVGDGTIHVTTSDKSTWNTAAGRLDQDVKTTSSPKFALVYIGTDAGQMAVVDNTGISFASQHGTNFAAWNVQGTTEERLLIGDSDGTSTTMLMLLEHKQDNIASGAWQRKMSVDGVGNMWVAGTITASGQTVVLTNDSRLSNSRTPTSHSLESHTTVVAAAGKFLKSTGANTFGWADHGLTYTDVSAAPSTHTTVEATASVLGHVKIGTGLNVSAGLISVAYGATSTSACVGNDTRLSDDRTPLSHGNDKHSTNYAADTITISAGAGLSGGGNLQANRTISMGTPSTITSATTNSASGTTHTHALTVTKTDVGLGNVENKSSATIRGEITSSNVTTALGYTPVNDAGDTITGDLYTYRIFQSAHGIPRNNLGSPSLTEMALFDQQFTNKLWFYDISKLTFEYTNDGVTWLTQTVSDTEKRKFVSGNHNSGVTIPNACQQYRIVIACSSYVCLNAMYMYWSSNSHSTTVTVQKRLHGTGVWSDHTTSTATVSSWPGHLYMPFPDIWFSPSENTQYDQIRIVFTPTWSSHPTYGTSPINLSGLEVWGGYPAGRRTIYSWDENQNVSFPAGVSASGYLTNNGLHTIQMRDGAQATILNALTMNRTTSHTSGASNGIGVGMTFEVERGGGSNTTAAILNSILTDVTAATPESALTLQLNKDGAVGEKFRINADSKITINNNGMTLCEPVSTTGIRIGGSNHHLHFSTNGSDKMYISTTGNVCIGGTNPDANYLLDVRGGIKSTGTVSADAIAVSNSAMVSNLNANKVGGYLASEIFDAVTNVAGNGVVWGCGVKAVEPTPNSQVVVQVGAVHIKGYGVVSIAQKQQGSFTAGKWNWIYVVGSGTQVGQVRLAQTALDSNADGSAPTFSQCGAEANSIPLAVVKPASAATITNNEIYMYRQFMPILNTGTSIVDVFIVDDGELSYLTSPSPRVPTKTVANDTGFTPDFQALRIEKTGDITIAGKVTAASVQLGVNNIAEQDVTNWNTTKGDAHTHYYNQTVQQTPNGSIVAFTLTSALIPVAGNVRVWKAGIRQQPDVDYTYTNRVITFTTAPAAGDIILVDFDMDTF